MWQHTGSGPSALSSRGGAELAALNIKVACLLAFAVVTACGAGSTPSPDAGSNGGSQDAGAPPAISSFTASPTVLPAGGGTVRLAWTVAGATSLSIDQGVGDVSSLSSASVNVSASTLWTLTANNASGFTTLTASVTVPASITVAGNVLGDNEVPAVAVQVLITGFAPVNTDSQGSFAIPGVTPPYDITVIDSIQKVTTTYQGLTRADPTLVFLATEGVAQQATLSGTITGGDATDPIGFLYDSGNGVFASGNSFSMAASWYGSPFFSGTLRALQMTLDPVTRLPTGYPGYGEVSGQTVSSGSSLANINISLSAISTVPIAGGVSTAADYALVDNSVFVFFPSGADWELLTDTAPSNSFSYILPVIPSATYAVQAHVSCAGIADVWAVQAGVPGGTTDLSLSIPPGPALVLPENAVSSITAGSSFSWAAMPGAIHIASFSPGNAAQPAYTVVTAGSQARIPDLSSAGLGLPSSAQYSWYVIGLAPLSSVDAFATPSGLAVLSGSATGAQGVTASRSFTTQ
jgi:hypothetical protein